MAGADFPLLIAHTPRAGQWNHVALLPPGEHPHGIDVAAFLSVPSGAGDNYLAVSAEVEQPTTGRKGREVLVLAGVALPEGEKLVKLEEWLRDRLGALGGVITRFDWDAHNGGPGCFPVLALWRNEAVSVFGLTPHPTQNDVPLTASNVSRVGAWRPLLAAAVGVAILGAGLFRRYGLPW